MRDTKKKKKSFHLIHRKDKSLQYINCQCEKGWGGLSIEPVHM